MLSSRTLRETLENYNYTIDKHSKRLYIMRKKHGGTSYFPLQM
jgi:hypothetical protein